jgi:hypothetical protein
MNKKYEVTDIAHPDHPWLHRIRAKENIGISVKSGDLGGFVENERNLSCEPGDDAWLFGDSVYCGDAHVCKDAILRGSAIAKDKAYVSHGAVLSGKSLAEDDTTVRGARMADSARISGSGMLIQSPDTRYQPEAIGRAAVYGKVVGNFLLAGTRSSSPARNSITTAGTGYGCTTTSGRSNARSRGASSSPCGREQENRKEADSHYARLFCPSCVFRGDPGGQEGLHTLHVPSKRQKDLIAKAYRFIAVQFYRHGLSGRIVDKREQFSLIYLARRDTCQPRRCSPCGQVSFLSLATGWYFGILHFRRSIAVLIIFSLELLNPAVHRLVGQVHFFGDLIAVFPFVIQIPDLGFLVRGQVPSRHDFLLPSFDKYGYKPKHTNSDFYYIERETDEQGRYFKPQ